MGSFGIWHGLVIMIAIGVLILVIAGFFWLLQRSQRSATGASRTVAARLQTLDRLLADGRITAAEHAARRAAILASV